MPHLLNINSYHYRRGGADAVYLDHGELMGSLGWRNSWFAMHHPKNLPCPTSDYFVDEIQFGHSYTLREKIVKATQVVYSFQAQRNLRRLIADRRPDVAHLHNIYHHLSPSILPVLKACGVPAVMTAHDLKLVCPNNKMLSAGGVCERCKGGHYHQAVRNRCVQDSVAASAIIAIESTLHGWLKSYAHNLDRIVVPSRFFIDKFVEWGWSRDRFDYVPNYVDAAAFQPSFEAGRHLVYFGRLSREKGLVTLVKAAVGARVPLVIVGTGPIEAELKSMARSAGARIEFAGYQTGTKLHALVRDARASVLPSECYENAPISVLESFALGRPAIGARIGGIPEMVRHGETGWLFDSGDVDSLAVTLRAAWDCAPGTLSEMGRRGRALVEREFSRAQYVKSMLRIYSALGVSGNDADMALLPSHA